MFRWRQLAGFQGIKEPRQTALEHAGKSKLCLWQRA